MERGTESVGRILERLFERAGWGRKVFEGRALLIWGDIVGDAVAAHARALSVRDGMLFVEVDDAVWKQEIRLLQDNIIKRMNERLGDAVVRDMDLVVRA